MRARGRAFEAFEIPAAAFDHEAHVRLAYVDLCEAGPDQAAVSMKRSLLAFLEHLGVGAAKCHETMTPAWIDAVHHFMESTAPSPRFARIIARNPVLLDSKIMLAHDDRAACGRV